MRRPWNVTEAWNFVQALLASPGLDILVPTQQHPVVAEQVFGEIPHLAGNLLHDAHTAILMREHSWVGRHAQKFTLDRPGCLPGIRASSPAFQPATAAGMKR
jgi:hypothetical protein